ncbi:MAG: hypothetical protein ABII18_12890 [bacterium]
MSTLTTEKLTGLFEGLLKSDTVSFRPSQDDPGRLARSSLQDGFANSDLQNLLLYRVHRHLGVRELCEALEPITNEAFQKIRDFDSSQNVSSDREIQALIRDLLVVLDYLDKSNQQSFAGKTSFQILKTFMLAHRSDRVLLQMMLEAAIDLTMHGDLMFPHIEPLIVGLTEQTISRSPRAQALRYLLARLEGYYDFAYHPVMPEVHVITHHDNTTRRFDFFTDDSTSAIEVVREFKKEDFHRLARPVSPDQSSPFPFLIQGKNRQSEFRFDSISLNSGLKAAKPMLEPFGQVLPLSMPLMRPLGLPLF